MTILGRLLCLLGRHRYNEKFVGLLYRECGRCGRRVHWLDW
jgi:hypothetical protein